MKQSIRDNMANQTTEKPKKKITILVIDTNQAREIREIMKLAGKDLAKQVEITTLESNPIVPIPSSYDGYLINPECVSARDLRNRSQELPKSYFAAINKTGKRNRYPEHIRYFDEPNVDLHRRGYRILLNEIQEKVSRELT